MKKYFLIIIAMCVLILLIVTAVLIFGQDGSLEHLETQESVTISETTETATASPSPTQTAGPTATTEATATQESTPTNTPYIFDNDNPDYREAMRQWVMKINSIAKEYNSEFLLIPQNCAPIFTDTGDAGGEVVSHFISAIDGIGVEGISYGSNRYNRARKESSRDELVGLLNVGTENGVKVLAVDYCSDEEKIEAALSLNERYGYLSFIAESLELTSVPTNKLNINDNDVLNLSEAENWLYLLNPEKYSSKQSFVKALSETDYDVIVIDAFFDTDEMLNAEDVAALKTKKNGAARIVIAYMSIGEAEDYRYYWKKEYDKNPPSWMLWENSQWEGNYPVEYWNEQWQEIIATGEESYLKRILNAGFSGVYLDIVDGYETFEDME